MVFTVIDLLFLGEGPDVNGLIGILLEHRFPFSLTVVYSRFSQASACECNFGN